MKLIAVVVALAVGGVVCVPSTSHADAPSSSSTARIRAYVEPSVVHVETTYRGKVYDASVPEYVLDEDGRPKVFTVTSACTGFIVNSDGYVSSAGHCVDPQAIEHAFEEAAVSWYIHLGAKGTPDQVLKQADFSIRTADPDSQRENADRASILVAWGSEGSQRKKARVISFQTASAGDAALLKIPGSDLRAVKLTSRRDLEVGTGVVSVGYAGTPDAPVDDDFQPSFAPGEVGAQQKVDGGSFSEFQVSAALPQGMSGGPVTTTNGEVIGFNGLMAADDGEAADRLGLIGSQRILQSLSAAGVENELGPTSTTYVEGLDAYFAGDKERAVQLLQDVVDAQPKHPTAQAYLDRAKKLSDDDGSPIALMLGAAIAIAIAVAAVIGAVARRARQERPDERDDVVVRRLRSLVESPVPGQAAGTGPDVGDPGPS